MEIDIEFVATFLDEAQDALEEWEALCLRLEKTASRHDIDSMFRVAHNIKGSSKSVGLVALGSLVHKIEDILLLIKEGRGYWSSEVSALLLRAHSCLREWIKKLRVDHSFVLAHDDLLLQLKHFHQGMVGEPQTCAAQESSGFGLFDEAVSISDAQQSESSDTAQKKVHATETVRVAAHKLDTILQTLGELSIARSILAHGHKQKAYEEASFGEAINLLDSMVRELQHAAFSLRMQPLTNLFQRLERTARDVAEDLHKKVQVVTVGEETELDRTVSERLMDALIHLVRNCVDHGLESTEQRQALGKNPSGTLKISAENIGSNVVISLEDDGAGLDTERIRAKAIERNIIPADKILTEAEIHQIILLPGFSTSACITSISGRGVGMDVVKTSVEDLGGSLSLKSRKGSGTHFEISIPTTMSIIDSIIVRLEGRSYAVPISDLAEIIDLRTQSIEKSGVNCSMILRDERFIPLIKLKDYLPAPTEEQQTSEKVRDVALLIAVHGSLLAFEVDAVLHKQPVVVRPLSEKFCSYRGISGSTILADGKPALILSMQVFGSHFVGIQQGKSAA